MTEPAATAIIIGYCIFAAVSFVYALFHFCFLRLGDYRGNSAGVLDFWQ